MLRPWGCLAPILLAGCTARTGWANRSADLEPADRGPTTAAGADAASLAGDVSSADGDDDVVVSIGDPVASGCWGTGGPEAWYPLGSSEIAPHETTVADGF